MLARPGLDTNTPQKPPVAQFLFRVCWHQVASWSPWLWEPSQQSHAQYVAVCCPDMCFVQVRFLATAHDSMSEAETQPIIQPTSSQLKSKSNAGAQSTKQALPVALPSQVSRWLTADKPFQTQVCTEFHHLVSQVERAVVAAKRVVAHLETASRSLNVGLRLLRRLPAT